MRKIVAASFRWPGGKFLLAPEITKHIPKHGRRFVDLFAGRANVFFRATAEGLDYKEWVLNDPLTAPFLRAIRDVGDKVAIPQRSREEFDRQKVLAETGDQRALLLEPYLCFNGGNYSSGGSTTEGGRRTPRSYEANLRLAHKVMCDKKPRITQLDWLDCVESENPGPGDFVLLDVPYLDCEVGPYDPDSVIRAELVQWLKGTACNWILCEYRQPFYLANLGEPLYTREVQNRATNFAKAPQQRRFECLWTNIGKKSLSVNVPKRCGATLRVNADKDYRTLSTEEILRDIAEAVAQIESNQIKTSAEMRKRLLPALIVLKKRLKRKKPGYEETLRKMGIAPSTVRSWFYRGRAADEVIEMLEREPRALPVAQGVSAGEPLDATDELLRHADRMAAAVLRGKMDWARRLAAEYANARRMRLDCLNRST